MVLVGGVCVCVWWLHYTYLLELEAGEVPAEGEALEWLVNARVHGANAVGDIHNPRQLLQLIEEILRYGFARGGCRGGTQRDLARHQYRRRSRIRSGGGERQEPHTQQQQERGQFEEHRRASERATFRGGGGGGREGKGEWEWP